MSSRHLITERLSAEVSRSVAELYGRAVRSNDEWELYNVIAAWVPELVPADRASITLLVEGDEFEILGLDGTEGVLPIGKRIPVVGAAAGHAMTSGETYIWRTSQESNWAECVPLAAAGLDGVVNAPLIVDGEGVGSLNVARADEGYEEHHARLLADVAAVISLNLGRFRALADTRRALANATRNEKRLRLLGALSRRLTATVSEEQAFTAVANALTELLDAERVSLAVVDRLNGTAVISNLVAERAESSVLGTGYEMPLSARSCIGHVVEKNDLAYFPNLAESPFAEHHTLAGLGLKTGISIPVETHGEVVAVLNSASRVVDAFGAEDRFAAETIGGLLSETLERIRVEETVVTRDRQLAGIVDDSPLLMITVDDAGTIVQLSRFGAHQLGLDAAEVRGKPLWHLYPPSERSSIEYELAALAKTGDGDVVQWTATMIGPDEQPVLIRHFGRQLTLDAERRSSLIVCEDITAITELSDRLAHEATHDPLTGVLNRREFDRQLQQLSNDPGAWKGCVCFIDIDQFKIVNDTAGHRAGDALLFNLAEVLASKLHPDDLFARLGGDEFAVFLPGCSIANAVHVAERLRVAARDLVFSWGGRTFGTSVSVGLASIDPTQTDPDDVLVRADAACYDAKQEGRDRVSIATINQPELRTRRADGEWGSRLREALELGDFRLMGQLIAPVAGDDSLSRLEVLIRVREPDGQLLPAGAFIPAAERLNFVTEIDRWVVGETVRLLGNLEQPVIDKIDFVTVNLSPRSIESESFLDELLDILTSATIDPSKLLFEITETAAFSTFSKAVRFIETVSLIGCRFALDDFGAGFSTFHYLKRLPVDVLKIDGSLIRDIGRDRIDQSIVGSIAEVAATLNMSTVAEWVEDSSTLHKLKELGIDYAQGYALGRPEPIEDVLGAI